MYDSDEFLNELDKWLQEQKHSIYDMNISDIPAGNSSNLNKYCDALEILAHKLTAAIENEDMNTLNILGFPPNLQVCIRDMDMCTYILDRIDSWFIRYPFVKSRIHLEELRKENAGLQ